MLWIASFIFVWTIVSVMLMMVGLRRMNSRQTAMANLPTPGVMHGRLCGYLHKSRDPDGGGDRIWLCTRREGHEGPHYDRRCCVSFDQFGQVAHVRAREKVVTG